MQIPGTLSTIDSKSGRTHSKRILPCIISPSSHRVLDLEEHKILKSLAIPYEKSKNRKYYERLEQIKGLPETRKVLFYSKKFPIKGRKDTLFVVEISRTKL